LPRSPLFPYPTLFRSAVARECDVLLVLGDLINVLDYRTWDGILVEVFGREAVVEAAELRARGRFDDARTAIRRRTQDPAEARDRSEEHTSELQSPDHL